MDSERHSRSYTPFLPRVATETSRNHYGEKFHRRIAEVLRAEQFETNLSLIAHHLVQALPTGDVDIAIDFSVRAAKRAMETLAYEQAEQLYQMIVRVLESHGLLGNERHCNSILDLAFAQQRKGRFSEASGNFDKAIVIARNIENPSCLARAFCGLGLLPETPGTINVRLIRGLEEALEKLSERESTWQALSLGRLAEALQWSDPESRRSSQAKEATLIARKLGDAATLADVLYRSHIATLGPGSANERLATSTEIVKLARECRNARLELTATYLRIRDLLEIGDIVQLDREIRAYSELTVQLRQQHLGITEAALAMRSLLDGRFEDAEQLAIQALTLGQNRPGGMASQAYAMQISAVRREQDRLAELEPID